MLARSLIERSISGGDWSQYRAAVNLALVQAGHAPIDSSFSTPEGIRWLQTQFREGIPYAEAASAAARQGDPNDLLAYLDMVGTTRQALEAQYTSDMGKAYEESLAESVVGGLTNFSRNNMGTVSFDAAFPGMRKAQDFIVYPMQGETNLATIQSDTRIGKIDLTTGQGILSQSHPNGAYYAHLAMDRIVPIDLSPEDASNLRRWIRSTAGELVGGVVKSDNTGAFFAPDDRSPAAPMEPTPESLLPEPSKTVFEARPVHTSDVITALSKAGYKVVDSWYYSAGTVALVRSEDGQAYEVTVTPAANPATFAPFKQHYGTGGGWTRRPGRPVQSEGVSDDHIRAVASPVRISWPNTFPGTSRPTGLQPT